MKVFGPHELSHCLENFSLGTDHQKDCFGSYEKSRTRKETFNLRGKTYIRYVNEFWTSRQRQACSIHEISYRACFKPQLPRFFITLLSSPGDPVYDPFSGRGTSVVEAGLLARLPVANDANPLSEILSRPRFFPPDLSDLERRLYAIQDRCISDADIDLSMFFHEKTLREIRSMKCYLRERRGTGKEDLIDRWIRMVATNRLTGHSSGFFSVYTLPPNQALSAESQKRINKQRKQVPEYRDTRKIILKKTRTLLKSLGRTDCLNLHNAGRKALFLTEDASHTPQIKQDSIQLTVTSPPFLDVVQYTNDNWLRCWFNDLDTATVAEAITMAKTVDKWAEKMQAVFHELYRITRPGGWAAFEVGEVRRKTLNLDEQVAPIGIGAGFSCVGVLINLQKFTKTANIWGITNNREGTNTNRIVVFYKPDGGGRCQE